MTRPEIPTIIGTPFGGGFFAGTYLENDRLAALIVAPKEEGEAEDIAWGDYGTQTAARSLIDGLANTRALAEGDHPAAKFCVELRIGGFDDWHLPALDQLTVLRANLMPDAGYVPAQTMAEAFKDGAPEAFEQEDYWSSTEFSAVCAWIQHFGYGGQLYNVKYARLRCRAVRKILI